MGSRKSVCVIIRVYSRVEDLVCNLEIIRKTWTSNDYYIIVSGNGKEDGYKIPEIVSTLADKVLESEKNDGHYKGNARLILNSIPNIPKNCEYTILLEADTWKYSDVLISEYIEKMDKTGAVWSSARWFYRLCSNATDFAILNTKFLISNSQIVDFKYLPECWVSNFLADNNKKGIYINELKPIQLPVYIKNFPYAPNGRFNTFPKAQMVTHHIEDLAAGMNEKKYYFNLISGLDFFETSYSKNTKFELFKIKLFRFLACLIPGNIVISKRRRYTN